MRNLTAGEARISPQMNAKNTQMNNRVHGLLRPVRCRMALVDAGSGFICGCLRAYADFVLLRVDVSAATTGVIIERVMWAGPDE